MDRGQSWTTVSIKKTRTEPVVRATLCRRHTSYDDNDDDRNDDVAASNPLHCPLVYAIIGDAAVT